jgi:hypothetical protein
MEHAICNMLSPFSCVVAGDDIADGVVERLYDCPLLLSIVLDDQRGRPRTQNVVHFCV